MAARKRAASRKAKTKRAQASPSAAECIASPPELRELRDRIEGDGGAVVGSYIDPFGGKPLLFAVLPIDRVEPTPFQRDVSETHQKRLADVIGKTGRFLDPIICVTAPGGGYWTPNGNHRLQAMRKLEAKAITALVVPEHEVAWQILALNTERAHNLRERALEVVRIYRNLLETRSTEPEESFAFFLEDPALVTLGVCYESAPRFAGGAYHPVLRRAETFSTLPLGKAIAQREKTARLLGEVEANVAEVVRKLRERGLTSPYLRPFVVARINPLRWIKARRTPERSEGSVASTEGEPPPIDEVLTTMRDKAARFNVDKVRQQDLMGASGPPPEE